MPEYKTMRVPEDAWEAAKAYKEEHDLTWDQYLRLPVEDSSTDTDLGEVLERVDRNYEAVKEATQAAQNAERATDELR